MSRGRRVVVGGPGLREAAELVRQRHGLELTPAMAQHIERTAMRKIRAAMSDWLARRMLDGLDDPEWAFERVWKGNRR